VSEILTREEFETDLTLVRVAPLGDPGRNLAGEALLAHDAALRAALVEKDAEIERLKRYAIERINSDTQEALDGPCGYWIKAKGIALAEGEVEKRRADAAEADARRLREAMTNLMCWGVEFDDERIGYVSVQVDRVAIDDAKAVLAPAPASGEKEGK